MIKTLHLTLILLLSCALLAQKDSVVKQAVSWGADFSLNKGKLLDYQLGNIGNDSYQLWLTPEQAPAAMLSFNHEHQLRTTQLYRLQYDKPNLEFQDFITGVNDTSICFKEHDFTTDVVKLYTASYKRNELGPLRPLSTFSLPEGWSTSPIQADQKREAWGVTPISRSPNKSVFAYVEAMSPKIFRSQSSFIVSVFDERGQFFWSKRIDKGDSAEYITALDVAVSDRGEVFILAQLQASQAFAIERRMPHIAGYRMQMFHCTQDTVRDVDIFPEDGIVPLVSRIHLTAGQAGKVMIAGLYQNLASAAATDGFFVKRIDLDQSSYTADHYPFAQFDLGNIASTKNWLNRLVLRDYFQFADGSFGVVAEIAYTLSTQGGSSNRAYFSHHALIAMFNPEGELQRISVLDKQLNTSNLSHCSYGMGVSNDQLYFVYNEKGTSLNNRFVDSSIGNQALGTVIRALGSDGAWKDPILLNTAQTARDYIPPGSAIITDNYCFLLGRSRKRIRVGTVNLTQQ